VAYLGALAPAPSKNSLKIIIITEILIKFILKIIIIVFLADTYVAAAAREAGSAAELAATRKTAKYSNIQAHHIFQPVAVESHGPINASGRVFLSKLGRKLAHQSGDDREIGFLFQRLSVLIQRYNAILLHDCFVKEEEE